MRPSAIIVRRALLSLLTTTLVPACAVLPDPGPQAPDPALPPASVGTLREVAGALAQLHGAEHSSLLAITNNHEAMMWRLMIIDEARSSLDLQYFIWDADPAAGLLFERLLRAADRGVRVRLLVDDLLLQADDTDDNTNLAAISSHPHFDLKLFNPTRVRRSRAGKTGQRRVSFRELNRRMHNKLLIADGSIAITGGRDAGAAYFGISPTYNYRDLDILAAGRVVPELTVAFDQYWNSPVAYPTAAIDPDVDPEVLSAARARRNETLAEHADVLTYLPMKPHPWSDEVWRLLERMTPADARFLQNVPEQRPGPEDGAAAGLMRSQGTPSRQEIILVAPYLIPTEGLMENIRVRIAEGVRVKILTDSMAANNHASAHRHYKKYRRRILETGAELYEFRQHPSEDVSAAADTPPVRAEFISLHVKAVVGDSDRCTVGALSLDPRAMAINAENVLYVDSAKFCDQLAKDLDVLMHPDNAWRVELDEKGHMSWTSSTGTVTSEPGR